MKKSNYRVFGLTLIATALAASHSLAQSFVPTGSLSTNRAYHTATLLSNGKVLVAGGWNPAIDALSSAELYDPATGTWTMTGSLTTKRVHHTATLLPNGKVLLAGGQDEFYSSTIPLSSTELYDPVTGSWSATGTMMGRRFDHTATLLTSGQVLVAGGNVYDTHGWPPSSSAELYDAVTGTWKPTGAMNTTHSEATATLMPNGKVLVAGGYASGGLPPTAELYDPATGTWTETGGMSNSNRDLTATLLPNGQVLIEGGTYPSITNTASLYDPATDTWRDTGTMTTNRFEPTATLLPNGWVLVEGGSGSATEVYDPATETWTSTSAMITPRINHTATLLSNGEVLFAGGSGGQGWLSSAELYVSIGAIDIHNVAVLEGDSGTTNAVFSVLLATNHAEIVSVDFATSDITATAGTDYIATNGTLIFAPGETNKTIAVQVIGDLLPEADETFLITLSNPTNIVLVFNTAQGTILDDDTAPFITGQPRSQAVPLGSDVTFSVAAGGGWPHFYQWATNGVDLAGATNATLTRTNVQLADDGSSYSVRLTGRASSVFSDAAILTVLAKPVISAQPTPTNQTVLEGSTVSMSVSAVGTLPLSYSWRLNGTKVTNIILNSFDCIYTIENVQTNQAGSYKVGITNVAGSASGLTAAAVLTVLADSDHDGMPDDWERLYGFNPNDASDAAQDADLDGMTNWQEYIAGTDPRDPQSYLKVDAVSMSSGKGGAMLQFVAVSNRTYTVQSRAAVDHGEWSRVADVAAAPTNRLINLPDPLGLPDNPQRFYRLVTPAVR